MKKILIAAPMAAASSASLLATPIAAQAETGPPVNTSTTFTVNAGDLTISAPSVACRPRARSGSNPAGQLGTDEIRDDNRGSLEVTGTPAPA